MKRFTGVSFLTALALVIFATSAASQQGGPAGAPVPGPSTDAVFGVQGGVAKSVVVKIQDNVQIYGETPTGSDPAGFSHVRGGAINRNVPRGTADTFLVEFTAECQLRGGPGLFDWLELEVRVDGVPIEPHGDAGDPVALCADDNYNSLGHQFAARLGEGFHEFRVWIKIVDNGTNEALQAWIDDWTFSAIAFE